MDPFDPNRDGSNFGNTYNQNQINLNPSVIVGYQQQQQLQPQPQQQQQQQQQLHDLPLETIPLPFSNPNPTSFAQISSIVQPVTSVSSLSADIYSHTLSQYGPAIVEQQQPDSPILRPQCITQPAICSRPMGGIQIEVDHNFTGLRDNDNFVDRSSNQNVFLHSRTAHLGAMPLSTMAPSDSSSSMVVTSGSAGNQLVERARDELSYSPPPPVIDDVVTINPNSGRPMIDGKIPKLDNNNKNVFENPKSLLEMQEDFRRIESMLKEKEFELKKTHGAMEAMIRNMHGQANVELNPTFCKLKDQKEVYSREATALDEKLKKLQTKMKTIHNYSMARQLPDNNPILASSYKHQYNKNRHAKMSTSSAQRSTPSKNNDEKEVYLQLKDTCTWCSACDKHFNSLRDFGRHLHTNDHSNHAKKSSPWRTNSKTTVYNKVQTYNCMKSICSKITNDIDKAFTLKDVDAILNPSIDEKDSKTLKARTLARDNNRFDEDDNMFKIRGYDMIVPILGYYCQLCSKKLCDSLELDKHIASYDHVYSHFKSMALNPEHEKKLWAAFKKSYEKKYPPDDDNEVTRSRQDKDGIDKRKDSANQQQHPPPLRYKKATSNIVDEHEVLIGKLPETRRPASRLEERAVEEVIELERSDERAKKRKQISDGIPEIQPLATNRATGALKRLKKPVEPSTAPHKSPIRFEPVVTSDEEEVVATTTSPIKKNIIVEKGEKDSPWPEYELRMSENFHSDVIRDPRLKKDVRIKLTKIDLNDYKDTLEINTDGCWELIDQLMAKREQDVTKKSNEVTRTHTEPSFFSIDGQKVAVPLDELIDNPISTKDSNSVIDKSDKFGARETLFDNKQETEVVKESVKEDKEGEAADDVNSYMNTLNRFFLEDK